MSHQIESTKDPVYVLVVGQPGGPSAITISHSVSTCWVSIRADIAYVSSMFAIVRAVTHHQTRGEASNVPLGGLGKAEPPSCEIVVRDVLDAACCDSSKSRQASESYTGMLVKVGLVD